MHGRAATSSSWRIVVVLSDGDLEAQDLGCLAVIARVQDGDDLADDIAEHGVMLLLAGIPQLIEIRGHVIKAIEIDAGTHIARMRLNLDLASASSLSGIITPSPAARYRLARKSSNFMVTKA